ncbi:glycoside hydrolase family 18 protein [Chitinibacter tainanensis]|uniref:glycoside hydrolase family 18 protein n=1 Tax=Chitinibacter tainanensis TaxID=230667 RepID=UPI0023543DF9|nr:glycosyl hydrolase family 18 protein [Chitinibacter tainanensis]
MSAKLLALAAVLLSQPLLANDKLISYLPTWRDADTVARFGPQLAKLDYGVLSFIEVNAKGEAYLAAGTQAGLALWQPHLAAARKAGKFNCMWALGGWTGSKNIAKTAQTEAGRAKLIQSSIAIMRQTQCTGLDIDWEHPVTGGEYAADASPADLGNWVSLLRELRTALDAAGKQDKKTYLLTTAIPANNGGWVMQGYDLKNGLPYLNWVNLMAYDRSGGWSKNATLHASLYPTPGDPDGVTLASNKAVEYFIKQGAKPEQLVLGVPFYVRAMGNVEPGAQGNGLAQQSSGPGLKDEAEPGVATWADFQRKYAKAPGWQAYRSMEAGNAPYLYHPGKKELLSYDDPASLTEKVKFVKSRQLGGVMIWEMTQDDAQFTLLNTLIKALR